VAGLIVLIVIVVLVVILGLWAAGVYNGLVRLRNLVQEAWRQIDVELKRRHDLIPNLVETVKGYAAHEREALDAVVAARTAAVTPNETMQQQAEHEGALSAALGRLFAVAEAYPNLKANHNFLALATELTETEDRVAAGRRFYNANVRELNTRVESFPSNLFAGVFHFARADYFEIADAAQRAVPQVGFGGPAAPLPSSLPSSPASPSSSATTAPGAQPPPYGTPQ